jgi:N6-L-threonylcarbamoyladenine synthase
VVATQHDLHERFAGVVPEIASRAHTERLMPVVEEALREANVTLKDIDAVAVGHAPGLIGSLLVGVSAAKALAWSLGVPLIGVHHLLAHLHAPTLDADPIAFPSLSLIASGGHTAMYRQDCTMEATLIGSTIDDAVGEAFDKASSLLDAGYPGGPAIEKLAQNGDKNAVALPISRLRNDRFGFSFAGLKTALLYATRGHPVGRGRDSRFPRTLSDVSPERRADLAASFQHAAVSALVRGVDEAMQDTPAVSLCGGGGVLANTMLRERLDECARRHGVTLRIPPMRYCIDNAAMIAGLGGHMLAKGRTASWDLQAKARLPLGTQTS